MNMEIGIRGTFEICECHLNDPSFYFYSFEPYYSKKRVLSTTCVILLLFVSAHHETTQRLQKHFAQHEHLESSHLSFFQDIHSRHLSVGQQGHPFPMEDLPDADADNNQLDLTRW